MVAGRFGMVDNGAYVEVIAKKGICMHSPLLIRSLSEDDKAGLGVAFNEATLLGAEIDPDGPMAGITLAVLALNEDGSSPEDPWLQIVLFNVGRAAASLRLGRWDDPAAPVVAFDPSELLEVVQGFGGLRIYGWEFFDEHERELEKWAAKASFDLELAAGDGQRHSLMMFQEGRQKHLDVCIWFDAMLLRNAAGEDVAISDVIAAGRRWWDALHRGDSIGPANGIFPLR
jgi:hypothetical protein